MLLEVSLIVIASTLLIVLVYFFLCRKKIEKADVLTAVTVDLGETSKVTDT